MRGFSLAALRPKKITISLSYYNDHDGLEAQLEQWAEYDDLVKFQIMDDGSGEPAEEFLRGTVFEQLDAALYRVEEDIPWNIPGIRNLGAAVAQTPWILLCDMDQAFRRKAMKALCRLPNRGTGNFYSFARDGRGRTAGTMLVSLEDYWRVTGYDEDLTGNYGSNDGLFRAQMKRIDVREVFCEGIQCDQLFKVQHNTDRQPNIAKREAKTAALDRSPRGADHLLRFRWRRVI